MTIATSALLDVPPSDARQLVRQAITERQQVWAQYGNGEVAFCPHAVGLRRGDPYVLGFTLEATQGLFALAPGTWQWFRLGDLHHPRVKEGVWLTARRWSRPSGRFLDSVEIELA